MSAESSRDASRVEALEIRVAHQEQTIADLNAAITAQWSVIDALERKLSRLREEFDTSGAPDGGPEPPPPHY